MNFIDTLMLVKHSNAALMVLAIFRIIFVMPNVDLTGAVQFCLAASSDRME